MSEQIEKLRIEQQYTDHNWCWVIENISEMFHLVEGNFMHYANA